MDTSPLTDLTAVSSAAIRLSGLMATLEPGLAQVAQALTAPGLKFTPGGPRGYQWQYQPTALCKSDRQGRLVFRASWQRLASDFDFRKGGLLSIGMLILFAAPFLATKLRSLF